MSGTGDARIHAAVRAALRDGPRDVVDLARALRAKEPKLLGGREGALHAVLHDAVRGARLHVVGRTERGLAAYATELAASSPADAERPRPPVAVPPDLSRAAVLVSRGVRDPADRGRVVSDALAHLADLDPARPAKAFGSPKVAQRLLSRSDRGRPFVAFPATAGDHALRLLMHEGPWIGGAIVAFLLLKVFVVEPNVIPSESMVPTLRKGDRVLVLKLGRPDVPERWRVHTFHKNGVTYVKRVVGLPEEDFAIVHGEAWADGKVLRKPDALREALRTSHATWDFASGSPPGWDEAERDGGTRRRLGWYLPAHGLPEPAAPTAGQFELRDVYLELDVECPADGWVRLELGRSRQAPASWDGTGAWSLTVSPKGVRGEGWPGAPSSPKAPAPGRTRLSLSHVDGVLRATAGDVSVTLEVPAPDDPARVAFVVGGGARALALRLDRDLHYSYQWSNAVPEPFGDPSPKDYAFRIPKNAVFCLGDNTTNSADSRSPGMGAVLLSEVIGPVVLRIWPPSRIGAVE